MEAGYKKNNNVRGFTLVELLAVIVVLAIIMLIAVNAILPQMDKARQNAFAIEANGLIKSATQYVIAKSYTDNKVVDDRGVCVTVATLVDSADSELDKTKYSGYVVIKKSGNLNLYQVWLTNKSFMVEGAGVNGGANVAIDGQTHVKKYDSAKASTFASCPTTYENWG